MESISKKRKICQVYDDDEEEEEKIEKFYAIIKSIREARNRLMKGSDHDDHRKEDQKQFVAWMPTFQREDFMEDQHDHDGQLKNPLPLGSFSVYVKGVDDRKEEELDLRLSL